MWNWLKNRFSKQDQPKEQDIEMAVIAEPVNKDIIVRDEPSEEVDTPPVNSDKPPVKARKRKSSTKTKNDLRLQKKQEEKKLRAVFANDASMTNEYTTLAQTYGGLFSLSTTTQSVNKTIGSLNYGWVFFLGGLVKGFGGLVNIFKGDRSIASPMGLVESPIEMTLGAAMAAVSATMLTMDPSDSAYIKLQITNGILAGMMSGLLTVEQGYHRIRSLMIQKSLAPAETTDEEPQRTIARRATYARQSHLVNELTNFAQTSAGLLSLSVATSTDNPIMGSENFGWILFLGGLIKGFGSGVNILRGDRSIAGPLGLLESPIEMTLGLALLAISSVLLTINNDDSAYSALQITNGILLAIACGLLAMEQGYHKIRNNAPDPQPNTPVLTRG
ncbi:hypothetical protein Lwal_1340 [Legionella waltersii]|uniref:Transmembrane protein n=2 Tax=Legionella waltersii TaxID=66969 RepID=A0A0W1ADB5_9GAMM|nr:hypothetical protein Lwal_1340 [Legionella waltersii]SNV12796.1 Uncharacterised protein [Legionella waltersii]